MSEPKAYMPLFIGDYLADTSDLSAEEHGAYLLLLMTMWRRGGSLPSDADRLSRIAAVSSDHWPAVWAVIGGFFDEDGDEITQQRLNKELDVARDKKAAASERARHAARQRWARQRPDDDPSAAPAETPDDAPSNAPSMPQALPEAMLEQCPSPSPSPSTSTSPAVVDSIRIDVDAAAGEVMNYWNDLVGGGWSAESGDGEYLRERLLEGHSADICCLVVEAAVASGIDHPRRAFSRERFGALLATRKDPRRWAELRDEFESALDRYAERTA